MFAIVEACGRQYQIEAGRFVDLDLTDAAEGDAFRFDKVLMIVDGAGSTLGSPYIEGAAVTGRVIAHRKGRKIIVYHMRPKKGTRKKQGHRQHMTRVVIDTIELKDKVLAKAEAREKTAKAPAGSASEAPKAKKVTAAPKTEAKSTKEAPKAEKKPAAKKAASKDSE
jgi:large subunit ribosomal protein L21